MRSLLVLPILVACGPSVRDQARADRVDFRCKDRVASYVASHHMGGEELGVQLDCGDGPRVKRWKTAKDGKRDEQVIPISPVEFDEVWAKIDGTGWPNLRDCTNGTGGAQDPLYVFDVKDDQNTASFSCQSRSMPFPYNDIVDPLDMLAVKHKGQLGDDEPAELKKLDRRDKQR